jgi:hypothetical protein
LAPLGQDVFIIHKASVELRRKIIPIRLIFFLRRFYFKNNFLPNRHPSGALRMETFSPFGSG